MDKLLSFVMLYEKALDSVLNFSVAKALSTTLS